MSALLELAGLTKRFGGLVAVSSFDLAVPPGEIRALIGPNGAGKSTLLNMLSGITRPTGGTMSLGGARLDGKRPSAIAAAGLGRTFQVPRLFPQLSLVENTMVGAHAGRTVSFPAALLGLRSARAEEARMRHEAEQALDTVGLPGRSELLGRSATLVQRRWAEIARALMLRPRLLLLDEPAAGMNHAETELLAALLRRLRDGGMTILFVEHHMGLVMKLADRITVLDFGRKIAEGSPAEIRRDPAVLEAYLGQEFAHAAV